LNNKERINALCQDGNLPFDDWAALIGTRAREDETHAS
jgi:hypothetical protein